VSAKRAISLVATEDAFIADPIDYTIHDLYSWAKLESLGGVPRIQSVKFSFDVPEVIVLSEYVKQFYAPVRFSRSALFIRDNRTCQYCQAQPGVRALSVDHVIPRSQGGKTTWENCVTACKQCNTRKGDSLPGAKVPWLKSLPKRPHWTSLIEDKGSWEKFLAKA